MVISMYKPHFGTKFILKVADDSGPKGEQTGANIYGQITFGPIFDRRHTQE